MSSLRVLALMTDAFGGHGGIAKFNRDVLASIAKMPECTEVVCLPLITPRPVQEVPPKVRYVTAGVGSKLRYIVQVLKVMREGNFDLVLVGHVNLAALGGLVARWLNASSMLFVHGIDVWTPHKELTVRLSLPLMDRIVSVSQHTFDRLNQWAGLDPTRQRILPNCVDLNEFTPGPKSGDLIDKYDLHGRTVLMTLGRLASDERYKGFDEVLDALPRLAIEMPDLAYLICGTGPDQVRLAAKAAALGLSDRVRFSGYLDEHRKADHYRLADAYVMPSSGEGFGIVFLEALACGVPCMGSRLDGSREALRDGQSGVLVDPTKPDEVRAGILETLKSPRGAEIRPVHFSEGAFARRLSLIVTDLLNQTTGAATH